MDAMDKYLISKDAGKLQIPYSEYEALMEKLNDARRVQQVRAEVLEQLNRFLSGQNPSIDRADDAEPEVQEDPGAEPAARHVEPRAEKVSVEFSPEREPELKPDRPAAPPAGEDRTARTPPIKKDVEDHFNALDGSGRLLSVFMQYYTCLNESCRGIVRVTMKDGICSLWNYDKWEEFAFVDIHEGELRFAIDPRYTDDVASLEFCEVARLLASRGSFISIQVDDLNKTMLGVLTKAFDEVGLTTG